MPDETPPELDEDTAAVDETSLAGLSEYSATGGGGQPVHFPRVNAEHELVDEPEVPDASSFREMYRYSLGRATGDAHAEGDEDTEEGPLHEVARRAPPKKAPSKKAPPKNAGARKPKR